MASVYEVEQHMDDVTTALEDKEWHICALANGTVGGPGYNHEITNDIKELGHKLAVKCKSSAAWAYIYALTNFRCIFHFPAFLKKFCI